MKDITKHYSNGEVTIVWKPGLCIHSGNCFTGLPEVFKPGEKPWITPEGSTTEKMIAQVKHCPSGALGYFMNDPSKQEPETLEVTRVEVRPGGPLKVYGKLTVHLPNGEVHTRENVTSFCRCGLSKNKPFCDQSHRDSGFTG